MSSESDLFSRSTAWDLDELVSSLRAARSRVPESSALVKDGERPSRDAMVGIVRDLHSALFPSHHGLSDFTPESIDYFVGDRLDRGLRALDEQIRRGLRYVPQDAPPTDEAITASAKEIIHEFARALPHLRQLLEDDIRAAIDGDPAAGSRTEILLCYPGITAIIHHRLAHELYRLGVPLLARIISALAHSTTGIDIHPGAVIGRSFFIDHGTGVVIGETAVIGDRVRLYQGVTLGARNFPRDEKGAVIKGLTRHPVIGNDVVIYAGATVLGRIAIGNGSTIGGNVWVTHSLPPNSRIAQAKTRNDEAFEGGAGI